MPTSSLILLFFQSALSKRDLKYFCFVVAGLTLEGSQPADSCECSSSALIHPRAGHCSHHAHRPQAGAHRLFHRPHPYRPPRTCLLTCARPRRTLSRSSLSAPPYCHVAHCPRLAPQEKEGLVEVIEQLLHDRVTVRPSRPFPGIFPGISFRPRAALWQF